jgi:transcriptional regulator with XRE-family HTH domain
MLGMSQEQLSEALGLTFQQVQKYEKGINRISAGRLQQIAHILNVPIPFFFEGTPKPAGHEGVTDDISSPANVTMFLATKDGLVLCNAFGQIADVKLRRAIVDLVSRIADQ